MAIDDRLGPPLATIGPPFVDTAAADTGKSQVVKRPSLSFEFHDSRYAGEPFQLASEIEPKSGKI